MCTFYSISTFRDELSELLASKKDGYISVWNDIVDEFHTKKNMDEIRMTPSMIKLNDNIKIIKARIPNSYLKLGKSNGFRLIYLVLLDREEVVLLYVYPKRGKKGAVSIKDSIYIDLLETYNTELDANLLVSYNI